MTPWLRRFIFACILLFRQTESHYALLLHMALLSFVVALFTITETTLVLHRIAYMDCEEAKCTYSLIALP